LLLVESGVDENIGKDIHRHREILLQYLGIIDGMLTTGMSIQRPAYRVKLLRYLAGGTGFCAFKGHMLQKMREAVVLLRFETATDIHPYADSDRRRILHRVRGDSESIR